MDTKFEDSWLVHVGHLPTDKHSCLAQSLCGPDEQNYWEAEQGERLCLEDEQDRCLDDVF